jgi:hypothetical protein
MAGPGFGIEKLGAICVYPWPNMLVVVYYDISLIGAELSNGSSTVKVVYRLG